MNDFGMKTPPDTEFIKALRKGVLLVACKVCGQCHPKNSTHLYDYEGTVDDDLICHLCFQPFVNPADTKCGCTYCSVCLQNFLKRYKYCPIDNEKIDPKQTHKASPALRRILDKLLVVCPNVDYCEDALPRHQLESHLLTRCKGTVTYCTRAHLGCDFQGPRSALSSHLQECAYKDKTDSILRLQVVFSPLKPLILKGMLKEPIVPGRLCTLELHRGYADLGIHIVGGADTPLVTTVVQEVRADSVVAKDNRLQPGDHILRLNGHDLTTISHKDVVELFQQTIPICTMTVYRETLDNTASFSYEYREEILRINLFKDKGQPLGIKLGHRRKDKGVWIVNIIKGSLAEKDGRLKVNDRLLEINCQNVKYGSKEESLKIIAASSNQVYFLISREIAPTVPFDASSSTKRKYEKSQISPAPSIWQEFTLSLNKERNESLGVNIAGGIRGFDGESTPIFVSAIEQKSCMDKSKHIKKGDLIIKIDDESFIGCNYEEANVMIDSATENEIVSINYVRCPDSYDNDGETFKPTWRYFISIPIAYQIAKSVQVFKDSNEYLGITIAGGKDTKYDKIFLKTVIQNSSAAKSKKLRCGDMILSVDGCSLQGMLHSDAVQLMQSLSGTIRFVVISCPGTLI